MTLCSGQTDRQAGWQTGLLQDNWERHSAVDRRTGRQAYFRTTGKSEAANSTSAIYSLARRLLQSGGRFVTLPHYAWCVHENIMSTGSS
jgi:hypothetical protein